MLRIKTILGAAALLGAVLAVPALAQSGPDPVLAQARDQGIIGEQTDGYVGIVNDAAANADIRARVQSLNNRRRAAFTQRASQNNQPVEQMAAAFACEAFANQVQNGHYYRTENGQWVRSTGSVQMPSFCG